MKLSLLVAAALSIAPSLVLGRVTAPQGRQGKQDKHSPDSQRMWQDRDGQFALARPEDDRWNFRGRVRGPDGTAVPLLATSEQSGAQLVVQSAEDIKDLRLLARMLMANLGQEEAVHVDELQRVPSRGGEAYGFSFTVADETRGRVAVVRTGDHIALVIASWPLGAPADVAEDVEGMIGSLGPVPGALPPGVF
jgi:hypothetical protein